MKRTLIAAAVLLAAGYPCKPIAAEDSIKVRGDFANLKAATERGTARVVFLGGSITQNAKGHSAMLPEWLRQRFPDCEFEAINAGLSSTCSTTGAYRLVRDTMADGPVDLLVVEFAVNDDQDAMHSKRDAIRGMEGIIRQMRQRSPGTDILMVQYVNPGMLEKLQKGETPISIEAHEAVAEHYGITSVNVAQALAGGAMDWKTYGGTHPKGQGYALATELMAGALEKGLAAGKNEAAALPDPLDANSYDGADFVDPQVASWLGGWKWGKANREMIPEGAIRGDYEILNVLRADEPGSTLYLNFSGRAVGAFILAGPDAAEIEVSIDSGEWRRIETYHHHSKALNYPRSVMFDADLKPGSHQLVLRVAERKEGADGGGNAINLLMFEVNR